MCKYESLLDGTLGLHDIALMNDALRASGDSEALTIQAAREKVKRDG